MSTTRGSASSSNGSGVARSTRPARGSSRRSIGRRVLYSIFFVRSGWGHLTKRDAMITTAENAGFPFPSLAGWPSGVWLFAGSASIVLGIWPDIGALMLGLFVVPAAVYFHRFWTI